MPQANVKHWRRLDNAAKLFPAASSKRDTRVFRFYCELKEDIQQEILQKAVDRTLEKYPIFLQDLLLYILFQFTVEPEYTGIPFTVN